MNALSRFGALALVIALAQLAVASQAPCDSCPQPAFVPEEPSPSWIFRRSTYTHDPETGARVAQYQRIRPVEPLEDERNVTSRYSRSRTNLRGTQGSVDSTYTVQSWGNGRGGLDAEWERFHDAWKESSLQGGNFNGPAWGNNGPWNGNGWNNGWNGGGWNGGGWNGNWGPWNGNGWNGPPGGGWNGPGNWGPRGPGANGGGPGRMGPVRTAVVAGRMVATITMAATDVSEF